MDIKFNVMMNEEAVTGIRAAPLIDYYLAQSRFTCCTMQVGFEIVLDGLSWTDGVMDHFWHLGGWAHALTQLKKGKPEIKTFVWDESYLEMWRDGERLTMQDGTVWPRVTVPYAPFANELTRAAAESVTLMQGMQAELDRRYGNATLWPLLEGKGDKPRPADDDLPLKAAIILREVTNPTYIKQVTHLTNH